MIFSILAVGFLLVPSADAFWRLPCSQPVLDARVDPIATPGKPSPHAHTIMGSDGEHVRLIRMKENLISRASHWIQYPIHGPAEFQLHDMQSQRRQICILGSRIGTSHVYAHKEIVN